MTGTDVLRTPALYGRPQPLDGTVPEGLVTFDSEFFVEWQVADMAPVTELPHVGVSSGAR